LKVSVADAPVVLDEQAHRPAGHPHVAGPVLHAGLLRQPEQEVGEVEPAAARAPPPARAVQAREDEGAAGVRVGLVVRLVEADVAADPQRVPRERPRPAVGERQRRSLRLDGVSRGRPSGSRTTACGTPHANGSVATPVMPAAGDVLDVRVLVHRRSDVVR
jgi:hypothetical protein